MAVGVALERAITLMFWNRSPPSETTLTRAPATGWPPERTKPSTVPKLTPRVRSRTVEIGVVSPLPITNLRV